MLSSFSLICLCLDMYFVIIGAGTREPDDLSSFIGGATLQTRERGGGIPMCVAYAELIRIGMFICALAGL